MNNDLIKIELNINKEDYNSLVIKFLDRNIDYLNAKQIKTLLLCEEMLEVKIFEFEKNSTMKKIFQQSILHMLTNDVYDRPDQELFLINPKTKKELKTLLKELIEQIETTNIS